MRNLAPTRRRFTRFRVAMLGLSLFIFALLVGRRAVMLQIVQGDELREMAEDQYLRDIRLTPKRGTIYDRHGAELAVSVEVDSVWANPRELRAGGHDPIVEAARLSELLGVDRERIEFRLKSDRYFVWIKRRITPQLAARVRSLDIAGVHMEQEARRFYPNRELAAHLLGFSNVDGDGIEGIELSMDDVLHGSQRRVPAIRDRRGRVVFSEQLLDDRAARGDDITLSIDKTIQHFAERELRLAVNTFEARAGSVVVMDPRTGELLAVANFPTYNPNLPGQADAADRRNRAVTDRFEPGSTVKPFTIAAALAAGRVRSEELIDCENGAMEVAEYTIHDSHPHGLLTPAQILQFSSNIGTAKIGAAMGRRGLYRALRRFGFGETTDLPLPGETSGILRHYRRWYDMDAATIPFGQGMSVNAVQMATAMSVLANGGRLMKPTLITRIDRASGDVDDFVPTLMRQVIPRRTARLVGDMMTAVTGPGGTGLEAAIDGYLVAGKTGTAQKADYVSGGYAEDSWVASFAGFVPAEAPRLVISVVIDEPVIAHYGGTVAGPVFRRVGEASLRHLGVPAQGGGRALIHHVARREQRAADAQEQTERVATAAEAGPAPIVTFRPAGEGETTVPDLTGSTARGAVVALLRASLLPEVEGSGLVVGQEPEPGEIIARGQLVHVSLAPPVIQERRPIDDAPAPAAPVAAPLAAEASADVEARPVASLDVTGGAT